MTERIICPLLSNLGTGKMGFCLKEKCAWWIPNEEKCALAVLGWLAHFKLELME